jgi:outer membrane lipoprotein-sorting protein
MHRTLLGFILFVISASLSAAAQTTTWDVKQLMQGLGQVKAAKATFVERKYMTILNHPLESSGTLVFIAPHRLEKHILLPKPESMILDRDQVTLENKSKNQRRTLVLQDYPVIQVFIESIRSTLAGDLQTLNRFYQVNLEGNPDQWRLLLKPSKQVMQDIVSEIRISGNKNRIGTIEIIEAQGDRSVMTITEEGK